MASDRNHPAGVLAGLRVIDSATVWAMPLATTLMGDMGAEVIKVESTNRIDTRSAEPFLDNNPTTEYFNRSGVFNTLNRGKKSVTLNLRSEEGRELFKKLIAKSDILVENNRPGVMKRLGLDYEELSKINPGLIHLSNSGYGQTGPWQSYGAIALALEPTTGLSYLTGYENGPPIRWNWFTDYPTAKTAVFALLGAIRHRRRTGEGQWIDLSMYEVGVSLLGEKVLDFTMNGRTPVRRGNRHEDFAPQGCYPCAGEDRWVALSVRNQDEWARFCDAIGSTELASDERFRDAAARQQNHTALDELIAAWTSSRDAFEVASLLQGWGIPASAVQTVRDLYHDAHLRERGFWQWVGDDSHPVGPQPFPATLWRLSATPNRIQGPSSTLGQHNREVLVDLLGVDEAELPGLEDRGVIGTRPIQEGYVPRGLPLEERVVRGRWREYNPDFLADVREGLGFPRGEGA
jgi:benzylsuccinate CoA-transferase BbsF subunit